MAIIIVIFAINILSHILYSVRTEDGRYICQNVFVKLKGVVFLFTYVLTLNLKVTINIC